jgi:hypothetical protein
MAKKPETKTKLSVKKSAVKDLSVKNGGAKVKGGGGNTKGPNCVIGTGPISGVC